MRTQMSRRHVARLALAGLSAALLSRPHVASAQKPARKCCWDPPPGVGREFSGRVESVEKAQGVVVLKSRDRAVPFRFSRESGADEQRRLLDTLKPGDRVRARRMENSSQYHLERVR